MTSLRKPDPAAEESATAQAARVWVLDDPRPGTSAQAIGIAERLGVPFRRIPLAWRRLAHVAGLVPGGSLMGLAEGERLARMAAEGPAPALILSAGRRSAPVALWLKHQTGARIVHCMSPGVAGWHGGAAFDLLVIPVHDRPAPAANVLPVLGAPNRLSPLLLSQAESAWRERLSHLPRPRIALLVGGPVRGVGMAPSLAHTLGRQVARLAGARGGTVLATTSRRTGPEATEALAAGLAPVLHVLYRWGEPGENPYRGYLGSADAIIATADSVSMLSEACGTEAPVFAALPEMAGRRHMRMLASLTQAGQIRMLGASLSSWSRPRLDEAGRVAGEIRQRFGIE